MKIHTIGLALLVAITLVGVMASSAFAIEAFQERFEWGDMSKPTTVHGRVAVVDPYEKAAWINVAVFGGNAESGYYWQKYFPGKNLKVYAGSAAVWDKLKSLGKGSHSQAVMGNTSPSKYSQVEVVVQETKQNHRVVTSIKSIPDVAGTPGSPRSIGSLRKISEAKAIQRNSWSQNRKMLYDVMIPGVGGISGVIPNSDQSAHTSCGTKGKPFGTKLTCK
jgi:hypothetical protein